MELANHAVSVRGLKVGIADHVISDCDDVQLEPGDVLVLIGKNGSGKSTFLRTLSSVLKPITGEIQFDGRSQREIQIEKTIAWLSQEEHLEFSWTVREYVALGRIAQNSGLFLTKSDQEVVDHALTITDAYDLRERSIIELSGGERQRVRLARALAQETPMILMDEPTTHLDLEHQIQFLNLIKELAASGKTVVVSLHDVMQARQIGQKFLLFENGRATFVANPQDLTKDLLERTLGVRFEQVTNDEGDWRLLPSFCRTTD
jgi:iron complex transport system ATP-binding protein